MSHKRSEIRGIDALQSYTALISLSTAILLPLLYWLYIDSKTRRSGLKIVWMLTIASTSQKFAKYKVRIDDLSRLRYHSLLNRVPRLYSLTGTVFTAKVKPTIAASPITRSLNSSRDSPGRPAISTRHSLRSEDRKARASMFANLRPIHARGPTPKVVISASKAPYHLEGIKRSGSTKWLGLWSRRI